MDRKHQVFVSSTYEDLQHERQEVMHVLLELDCIPSGMELFPAANESQWNLIKGIIHECDYYVVVVAGRYGSVGPDGMSYTEMEYRYAVESNKPVVAFLHGDPDSIPAKCVEKTEQGRAKLQAFRALVRQRMCKEWTTPHELGSVVARSLVSLRKRYAAVGWIRADQMPEDAATEILELRKRVEQLERALQEARTQAPPGTENLAQGDEQFEIKCRARFYAPHRDMVHYSHTFTWNEILYLTLPTMMNEADEAEVNRALAEGVALRVGGRVVAKGAGVPGLMVEPEYFRTVMVQLKALGLIRRGNRPRSVRDRSAYWTLTPYGEAVMTRLRAITRREH